MGIAQDNAEMLESFPITRTTSDARDNVEKLRNWPNGVIPFALSKAGAEGYAAGSGGIVVAPALPELSYTIT